MSTVARKGAKEARNQFPALLDAAEKGHSTLITRHGRPVAILLPMEAYAAAGGRQQPLVAEEGSGRGLWGNSARTIGGIRDEWRR